MSASEARLDHGRVTPVIVAATGVGSDRDFGSCGWRSDRADASLSEIECSFVFGSDGGVEEVGVTQAHLSRDMPEQGHERLQRHASVDESGCVGVA